jgi:hypothetical protein
MGQFQKWCITGLFCIATLSVQAQTTETADREAKWQQDIQFFVGHMSKHGYRLSLKCDICTRGQKDFAKVYPPATFNAAIASLKADIPKLSDDEIGLRLMQLMASAHIAHNGAFPQTKDFSQRLPLGFYWYSDGLAVNAASQEYADALGARVVKIGENTPEQLLAKLEPYINYENDSFLRSRATQDLREVAVLRHFGLIGRDGRVAIMLEKPGQPPVTMAVGLVDRFPKLISLTDGLHLPTPMYMSTPSKYYWYQYLEDSKTLYIQYNRCGNDPKLSFKDFTKQVLAEADAHPLKRVVLDLRLNGGGYSRLINPLKNGLASRSKSIGHPYVLIGPNTFSAAEMNARDMQHRLKAILVGEPTGGTENSYGEVKQVQLPNSGIHVAYTIKFFGNQKAAPFTPQPEISAPRTLADDLAGRDAALEAAIAAP